ncbi:MAG: hypothetical protein LUC90_02755 [Lachnospiraceae bacterium]|nr:hypothetical protein [Lachnospiraceae bacterium]
MRKLTIKTYYIMPLLMLCLFPSLTTVHAQDLKKEIVSEYTAENSSLIIEEVLEIETSYNADSDSIYVTRRLTYEGYVTPPLELECTETIDGITYTGTLKLRSYSRTDNTTVAVYVGTLNAN